MGNIINIINKHNKHNKQSPPVVLGWRWEPTLQHRRKAGRGHTDWGSDSLRTFTQIRKYFVNELCVNRLRSGSALFREPCGRWAVSLLLCVSQAYHTSHRKVNSSVFFGRTSSFALVNALTHTIKGIKDDSAFCLRSVADEKQTSLHFEHGGPLHL